MARAPKKQRSTIPRTCPRPMSRGTAARAMNQKTAALYERKQSGRSVRLPVDIRWVSSPDAPSHSPEAMRLAGPICQQLVGDLDPFGSVARHQRGIQHCQQLVAVPKVLDLPVGKEKCVFRKTVALPGVPTKFCSRSPPGIPARPQKKRRREGPPKRPPAEARSKGRDTQAASAHRTAAEQPAHRRQTSARAQKGRGCISPTMCSGTPLRPIQNAQLETSNA